MAQLSRKKVSSTTGYLGQFTYTDDWSLTGQKKGIILQKITRTLSVFVYTKRGPLQELMPPPTELSIAEEKSRFDPKNNIIFLDTMTYWEAFTVPENGQIYGDQFQSNWFAPTNTEGQPQATTKGTYTIVGQARFYETAKSPSDLGLRGKLAIANGLASARPKTLKR